VIYETTQFVSNTAVQERAIKSNARAYTFFYIPPCCSGV
jgi:hypothetical protein